MLNLIGVHECRMDNKGRMTIPLALRKQLLPILEKGFVIKRSVFQKCLELYPMDEWEKIINKVSKLNRFLKKNNDFIRMYTAGIKLLEVDANSRLNIPRDLESFAGLQSKLVLSSNVGMIEVWDKIKYEETINDPSVDFGTLAEEVMGILNKPDYDLP